MHPENGHSLQSPYGYRATNHHRHFAGYGFTWGFIAAATAGLFALGMAFHDAEHLSAIFGLVIYLCVFLWSFAARSLGRVWAVLLGGGAAMAIAASLIQRHLI